MHLSPISVSHQVRERDEVYEPSKSEKCEGEDVGKPHRGMTEIEAVSSDVAKTNAQEVSSDDVALIVHQAIVPREVDMDERSLMNTNHRMHHLMNWGLGCGGGLCDVIVVVNDVAGVDVTAHHAVLQGGRRLAARVGALHGWERMDSIQSPVALMASGRTRIRTRVFGLEGRSDIQTTLYVQPSGWADRT